MVSRTKAEVTTVTDVGGGVLSERYTVYELPRVEAALHQVAGAAALSDDPGWEPFLRAYCAGVASVVEGSFSLDSPIGSAIRAFMDLRDPEGMPGKMTDVGRLFGR